MNIHSVVRVIIFSFGLSLVSPGLYAQSINIASECIDSDGDGWGWDGRESCVVQGATPAVTACIDTDGDGWGWDGVRSCQVLAGAPVVVQSGAASTQSAGLTVPAHRTVVLQPESVNLNGSLPYPIRTGFDIKSINTDFWPESQDLIDANTAGVMVNLVWESWQPSRDATCSASQVSFEGQCFTIQPAFDRLIRYWSEQGRTVTGILYGVPSWARDNSVCTATSSSTAGFCSARDPNDYARFVAMIAERYNGLNGNGRIADFVIHNEVNMNQWYKVGCGSGIPCDTERWIADYAANYNAAYDRVKSVQPAAHVLISFAHQFDTSFDNPGGANPVISVKTFIRGIHARAGGRKWRIAYHPYHKRLDSAEASFNDLPQVTFGNIGVLSGWLRQEFPFQPESWVVHLTENGVSSTGQSDEYSQRIAVCNSYRNVLGTPGMENYIYHRMVDHPLEAVEGVALGLRRQDGSAKPVWNTWANMSGRGNQRNNLDCGFENLPYTKLVSSVNNRGDYRASTRVVGDNYTAVEEWYLHRNHQPDTYLAYECEAGESSYVSTDVYCGGALSYGPVGFVYANEAADRVSLFTCRDGAQLFSSDEYACASAEVVEFIGYVRKRP